MKIAITGHTSGIGKSLFSYFKEMNHDVVGYSRSNGFDIENPNSRQQIIDQCSDIDIFINNAYSSSGQTFLLKELVESWADQKKKIINISSKLSFFPQGTLPMVDEYIKEKAEQNKFIRSLIINDNPKIMNVILGLVNTPMSEVFQSDKKLDPEKLAKLIYDLISQDDFYVQEVTLDVPDLHWKNINNFLGNK
jgi:short-subunit dehydrogenase